MAGVYNADEAVICTTKAIFIRSFGEVVAQGDTLKIPLFQRRYCWPSPVAQKLFCDISKAAALKQPHSRHRHSLGQILLSTRNVLDGQQRLTTLCLFLAALRDFLTSFAPAKDTDYTAPLLEQIATLLFPRSEPRDVLTKETVKEGEVVEGCAVLPTFFDRRSFFRCILPCAKMKPDGSAEDAVAKVYVAFRQMLEAKSWQMEMMTKLGTVEELPSEAEFVLDGKHAAMLAQAMLFAATRTFTFKVFEVEQTDVQAVFERMAFRESSLLPLLSNVHPGILAHEEDLIRNLLLSYFPTEAQQTAVYFKYWVPIERKHSGKKLNALFESYIQQKEVKEKVDILKLQHVPLPDSNRGRPKKYNTTFGSNPYRGGAQHLSMEELFPAYSKFRRLLESALVAEGIDRSQAPSSAKAERVVEQFLRSIVSFEKEQRLEGQTAS